MSKTPAPLLHTMKARQRVIAAISWDVRAKKVTIVDKLVGKNQQHDLDLSCFVYDPDGTYIDFVGPMAQDSMDQSGVIYHSGDDATGAGGGDDEMISCELAGVPDDVAQIIFVAEIRSNHVFADVDEPSFRLVDGMTDKSLFTLEMAKGKAGDKKACVIAKIFRGESPTGWLLQTIEDYPDVDNVPDWGSYLTRHLS